MSILDWFKKTEKRTEVSWDILSGSAAGVSVTPAQAENLSTVLSCVQVIGSSIASLPAWVFRATDNGREVVEHPLTNLIKYGPTDGISWPDFVEFMIAQILLRGNALAWPRYDNTGELIEIRPIPWDYVTWEVLTSGRLRYTATMPNTMESVTLLQDDVLHLRDRTDDTLIGKSRLARAASAIRTSIYLQEFSESLYLNGTAPSGALKHDQKLSKEAVQLLRTRFESAHQGSNKAGKFMILDNGLQWESMSISPEDAELLGSRKFATEEIARIFNVPPPLAGIWDHSSFTNSETAGRWFSQFTLQPLVKKIEAEFKRSVFLSTEDNLSLEIDLSGFMRGDDAARWNAHKIAVEAGILTIDEIREIEGWGPMKGGTDGSITG
jgi:HK97 family phage portal protein